MPKPKPITTSQQSFAPFSKTILTQSLLDAGLDVDHAYQVATAIAESLDEKDTWTRREITERVAAAFSQSFGAAVAEQYKHHHHAPSAGIDSARLNVVLTDALSSAGFSESDAYAFGTAIIETLESIDGKILAETIASIKQKYVTINTVRQHFHNLRMGVNKPVIILIGGATGSGKSTIAAEIGYRLGITKIVSTDSIREIMRAVLSKKLVPTLHMSSYEAYRRPGLSREAAGIPAFEEQALYVRVGAQALIERNIVENVDMIIDGVHLVPGLIEPVNAADGIVIPVITHLSDLETHRQRFQSRERRAKDRPAQRYLGNFEAIRLIQDHLWQTATQTGVPAFDNVDSHATAEAIINHILKKIEATVHVQE